MSSHNGRKAAGARPWESGQLPALVARLRSGALPLLSYIEQLEAHFEAREPSLLAFVPEQGRFERLRQEAQALLAHYPAPHARPPLFGVPLGVKDIFQVDGFITRAGSRLPPDLLQGVEAEAVSRLKAAGALVLGKTATTEFAYFAPGPTRNPHNPAHTPGGSSSGSAAAVAAGLCPLAFGTQTVGSVNRPAAFCGVVGYKPSYDRIPRHGVIPLAPSLDHVGLIAVDVAGIHLAASLLCRQWQAVTPPARPVLAVPAGPYLAHASPDGLDHFQETVARLVAAGYTVKEVPALADFEAIVSRHNEIMAAEAAQVHQEWFAWHAALYHPRTAELIRRGQAVSAGTLAQGWQGQKGLRQGLLRLMATHQVDLWLAPAAPGPAPLGLESTGDPIMNLPWTQSGLPAVNIPTGFSQERLPLGLQLVGGWYQDEAMLAWAAQIAADLAGMRQEVAA